MRFQRTKKVVSDSPGLVDIAIGLVNSVLNLPNGQVKFFVEFKLQKNCEVNSAYQKKFSVVPIKWWKCFQEIQKLFFQISAVRASNNVYGRYTHVLWYKFHSLHFCWLNYCYLRLYDFVFCLGIWHDGSTFLNVERIQECQGKAKP